MSRNTYTILGLLAILFWSTTFGFSRLLIEKLGIITATTSVYFISGLFSCAIIYSRKANRKRFLEINRKYLFICGTLFVFYAITVYLSVGLVYTRQQVIEVGLLNYLWPSLTIIFSIIFLKYNARPWVILGLILATGGVFLAGLQGTEISISKTFTNIFSNWYAYLLALSAAVSWGLFSNFSRLWGSKSSADGMPVFILSTGLILIIVRLFVVEESFWDAESIGSLIYMSIFPTFLGYQFWDKAMQKGDMILVASFSYFTPVLATIFSCIYLDLNCGWMLWIGCGLVLAGSIISKLSVKKSAD
ncbi:aromatic amino acid DMT transporter YddG [Bacteroidota bacterium]